jgi:hypothetical protein
MTAGGLTGTYSHPYSAFIQAVRRYRPSDLLPALAAFSAEQERNDNRREYAKSPPWGVAAAAKESLLHGNEHRVAGLPLDVVPRLMKSFNQTHDSTEDSNTVEGILTRIAYEQFPYQESTFEELTRTQAMLVDTPLPAIAGSDVADWESALGMSLEDAIGGTFLLWTWAIHNAGRIDLSLADAPHMQEVFTIFPRSAVEGVASRLTATQQQAQGNYRAQSSLPPHLERYAYNPLIKTPLVDLGKDGIVAPQTALIPRTVTPSGLFYLGIETWGTTLPRQLGYRVEAYVGRQLRSIEAFQVHAEIVYGKPEQRSVDWLVVTPRVVILVECKSRRLTQDARAGGDTLVAEVVNRLDEARGQINRSAKQIQDRLDAFRHIPGDRPMIGLIVTSDPFYMSNTPFLGKHLRQADIPTLYASMRELEHLVSLPPEQIALTLLSIATDAERATWHLGSALKDAPHHQNTILDAAWQKLSWVSEQASPKGIA